jgi:CubicO group peptidase (beta-lactamase class C family)
MDAAGPTVVDSARTLRGADGQGNETLAVCGTGRRRAAAPAIALRAASPAKIHAELASVVSKISSLGVPGGVISVTGGPVGRYQTAFGVASPGVPMTLGDDFPLGSVTKTFTATVIMKLVEQGRLRLNWTIAQWEPKLPNARRITIRMLLSMTSGIWDEGGTGPLGQPSALSKWIGQDCHLSQPSPNCGQYFRPQQLIDFAIQDSQTYGPAYPPGVYYYSDTNYMLLAIVAQKVAGAPFGKLLKRFIFDPLHLRNTSFPTHSLDDAAAGDERLPHGSAGRADLGQGRPAGEPVGGLRRRQHDFHARRPEDLGARARDRRLAAAKDAAAAPQGAGDRRCVGAAGARERDRAVQQPHRL